MTDTDWITPAQAAKHLPYGNANWVRLQLRTGRLRGSQVNGRWLTTKEAVDEMIAAASNSTARPRRRRAS